MLRGSKVLGGSPGIKYMLMTISCMFEAPCRVRTISYPLEVCAVGHHHSESKSRADLCNVEPKGPHAGRKTA